MDKRDLIITEEDEISDEEDCALMLGMSVDEYRNMIKNLDYKEIAKQRKKDMVTEEDEDKNLEKLLKSIGLDKSNLKRKNVEDSSLDEEDEISDEEDCALMLGMSVDEYRNMIKNLDYKEIAKQRKKDMVTEEDEDKNLEKLLKSIGLDKSNLKKHRKEN